VLHKINIVGHNQHGKIKQNSQEQREMEWNRKHKGSTHCKGKFYFVFIILYMDMYLCTESPSKMLFSVFHSGYQPKV
jgi:hypothetical protein